MPGYENVSTGSARASSGPSSSPGYSTRTRNRPWAGAVADRVDKRRLLLVVQTIAMLQSFALAALVYSSLGQEFIPTLDEKNIAMQANRIPSASLGQSQAMQLEIENVVRAFPQVAYVFSKTGTAEVATDPMPPNLTDTFIMLKPQEEWPDPSLSKAELQEQIEAAVGKLLALQAVDGPGQRLQAALLDLLAALVARAVRAFLDGVERVVLALVAAADQAKDDFFIRADGSGIPVDELCRRGRRRQARLFDERPAILA